MLKYQTSGDERVRDEHVAWDGIIKPVDDPFWNTVSAPNGYNCRCEIIQLSSGKPTNLDTHLKKVNTQFKKEGKKPLKNLNNTAPLFSDNVGKTGQVFNKNEHPYFDAPKSKLDTNFGLPVTQTLLKKVVKPKKFTPAKTIKEAEDYSKSLGVKSFKTDIAEDSLDAINAANKGFNDLKNAGHNLGDLNISFIDARARHMAHYIKARKEISFNPISWGRTNKQIDWNVKNSKDTGFYSVNDRSSLVIHEFGHHKHLNHLETLDFKEAAKTQFGKLSKQETELITKEVGKYASENPLEFVAETFTGMTYGKKYSKEIIKLYDKHHGMKIKTIKK